MSVAPGTRIGPYEVVSMLGAGGMGEVYRARYVKPNRDIALKVRCKHSGLSGPSADRRPIYAHSLRAATTLLRQTSYRIC